jgi:WD40 repeat protein
VRVFDAIDARAVMAVHVLERSTIVATGLSGVVSLWDMRRSAERPALHSSGESAAWCLGVRDAELVTGHEDGAVRIWDVRAMRWNHMLPRAAGSLHDAAVTAVAVGDGVIASGDANGGVVVHDATAARASTLAVATGHAATIVGLAFAGTHRLVSWSFDGDIRAWTLPRP